MSGPPTTYEEEQTQRLRERVRIVESVALGAFVFSMVLADVTMFGSWRTAILLRVPMSVVYVIAIVAAGRAKDRRQLELLITTTSTLNMVTSLWSILHCRTEDVAQLVIGAVGGQIIGTGYVAMRWAAALYNAAVGLFTALIALGLRYPDGLPPPIDILPAMLVFLSFPPLLITVEALKRERAARYDYDLRTRLAVANAELERGDRVRRNLFAQLAHDLRTPLTLIRGRADLLRGVEPDEARAAGLDQIVANATSAADLIEQLLELARLESGKTPFRPSPCDAARVVEDVVAQRRPIDARVRLAVDAPDAGAVALADPGHLHRIIANLVDNAIRHVPPEGGEVRVALRASDGAWIIDVENDGEAVREDRRERIFERYVSFDDGRRGTAGIGLPLARELAQLGGGTLELVSGAPRTTFRLIVPAADGRPPSDSPTSARFVGPALSSGAHAPGPSAPLAAVSRGVPLLVVEDDADMRRLVADALSPDFDVHGAPGVRDALACLETVRPSAILADVFLADGTGHQLLSRVKADRRSQGVPVLLFSAAADPEDKASALAMGADDFVGKPFAPLELKARLLAAVARAEARSSALANQREVFLMELHDGASANLSRAALLLDGGATEASVAAVRAAIAEALDEIRTLLTHLDAGMQSVEDLWPDLRRSLADACEQAGVSFEGHVLGHKEARSLGPATAHALRRIAREAVTNVIRHASANEVRFTLTCEDELVRIVVMDDGRGFLEGRPPGRGLGILRRRAERLGGKALFGNRARGAFVEATLPVLSMPAGARA